MPDKKNILLPFETEMRLLPKEVRLESYWVISVLNNPTTLPYASYFSQIFAPDSQISSIAPFVHPKNLHVRRQLLQVDTESEKYISILFWPHLRQIFRVDIARIIMLQLYTPLQQQKPVQYYEHTVYYVRVTRIQ